MLPLSDAQASRGLDWTRRLLATAIYGDFAVVAAGALAVVGQASLGVATLLYVVPIELAAAQALDLDERCPIGEVIDRMRALTTDRWDEAAYFEKDGVRYRIRVEIQEEG